MAFSKNPYRKTPRIFKLAIILPNFIMILLITGQINTNTIPIKGIIKAVIIGTNLFPL
mgnify:FL=1